MEFARHACLVLALLPSSSCGDDEYPPVAGHFAFNNANDHEIAVYVRTLREDLRYDCEALASNPGATLVDDAFDDARHWLLPARTSFGVYLFGDEPCGAAWIGGEGIEPRIVFVPNIGSGTIKVFEGQSIEPSSLGAAHVGVRFDPEGRATWVGDTELVHAPTSADPELPPACEPPTGEQRIDWSVTIPQGRFELLDLELGVDACAELTLQPLEVGDAGVEPAGPVETTYVCAPEASLSAGPGESLTIGAGQNQVGLRRLGIALADPETLEPALDDAGNYLRATSYYRDASLQEYRSRAFPTRPEPRRESSCPWQRVATPGCATVERVVDLYLDDALVEPGAEIQVVDAEAGLVYRSTPTFIRQRALVDPSCSGGPADLHDPVVDYTITLEPAP